MENQRIIVDTSIWIEYFKNNQKYAPFIEDSLNLENILISGSIISELLHGVPLTDVLISVIAIRHDASIFTLDKHFKSIDMIKLIDLGSDGIH